MVNGLLLLLLLLPVCFLYVIFLGYILLNKSTEKGTRENCFWVF
jgi:uncharacterized protein YneF (UPF0154 family)